MSYIECEDSQLVLGSTCVFVGTKMSQTATVEQAKQQCVSQNAHLAYVKTEDDFRKIKTYMNTYNSKHGWNYSGLALGGTYNVSYLVSIM